MTLDNQKIISPRPIIPKLLKNKISLFTNCTLTEAEIKLFNIAMQCVANQLEKDQIDLSDYFKLNVFFTEDGHISFHENDERNNGSQIYMAVYRMNKLRKVNTVAFSMVVYVEELAHYFWREFDETKIKYKVVEIIHDVLPNVTIDVLKGWGLNGL